MTRRRLLSITDVAERQLCTGCGACAYVQPDDIEMVDDLDAGRRPVVASTHAGEPDTRRALAACPGVGLTHEKDPPGIDKSVRSEWGPVLEVWEGYATDPTVRRLGSSGGAATALALHSLSAEGMYGVLHIRGREDVPYLNETVLSTSRDELLAATGSRYAPASPCDRLDLIRDAPGPCVFIGKPCDVAATSMVRRSDPSLDRRIGLTIGIFCAGTPTTRGTLEMLRTMGVEDPDRLLGLRFRGDGWPGEARATYRDDGSVSTAKLTYAASWGAILERHRQWRCYVCADHTSEFADIAVGDPWYRSTDGDPGRSLIVVRTERGRRLLQSALRSTAVTAHPVGSDRIAASQPGILSVRGAVWGRLAALRLVGIPTPRYRGLPMLPTWAFHLSLAQKSRSVIGLFRRIRRRGLHRRQPVQPFPNGDERIGP